MANKKEVNAALVPQEIIEKKIFLIRGKRVMLDRDLANLYDVTTGNLNKAVVRNLDRFPQDFMFQLDKKEFSGLIFHFGTSKQGGTRKLPRVFTEHGILMLSSVLNSKRAIQVNIDIMRIFVRLREFLANHKELRDKIEAMEKKYDSQFQIVFDTVEQLMEPPPAKRKPKIGFHA